MNWNKVYEDFQVNQEMIWLNNCGTTPAGQHNLENVNRFLEGYARRGLFTDQFPYNQVKSRIKKILAELLNCQIDELAIIHNTAEGMNFISHGLEFNPGDEIILLENEYPSNYYPWLHLQSQGVQLLTTPMKDTPETFFEELQKLITPRTRAVSLSAVHWCTGMPLPIEAIGNLLRQNQIAFIVDGAQGVGIQPIDVKKAHIGYMSFSAWKWLMGPLGLGILYVDAENMEKLNPIFMGSDSVVQSQQYLPYKSELKPGADRFVYSTANYIDWVYFLASLEYLAAVGFDTVRNRIFELSAYLYDQLAAAGFELRMKSFSDHPTGVIVGKDRHRESTEIIAHLQKNNIIAAERLGNFRLAPHIYNSFQQLERVIDIIQRSK